MALSPVKIDRFGGLDLLATPDEAKGAIDLLNAEIDQVGGIRSRDGYTQFVATTAPTAMGPYYTTAGTRQLLAHVGATTTVYNTSGTVVTSKVFTAGSSPMSFVRFGTPTAERVYLSNGEDALNRWDGAAFTALAPFVGRYLAVQTVDNRLVAARIVSPSYPSRVAFSDAGDPETWGANNYVDLTPGDGETIQAVHAWRELVFVFKETKFFVFYGNSIDSTGQPVFNYRPVDSKVGPASNHAVVAARDGLYFTDRTGVYRTTGGAPELVSRPVDPIFNGGGSSFYVGGDVPTAGYHNLRSVQMLWFRERLYISLLLGSIGYQNRLLVYDPRTQVWLLWDIGASSLTSFQVNNVVSDELIVARPGGAGGGIMRFGPAYTTDNGTAITSRYRSSFQDFGEISEKSIRETLLDGTGSPSFAWSRDWGSLGSAQAVTLGTSPALSQGRHRQAVRGRLLSWQLSATSPWSLQKMAPLIRSQRHVGAYA